MTESFELKGGIDISNLKIFKTTINAGFKHSQKDTKTLSHEEKSVNTFFKQNHGEIYTGDAVCYADDIRIVRNIRPKFSMEFLQGTLIMIYQLFSAENREDYICSLNKSTLYLTVKDYAI